MDKGVVLPVIVVVDVLTGYLSVYFGIYWQLLKNIFMDNLATNSRLPTQEDPSMTYFQFCQI